MEGTSWERAAKLTKSKARDAKKSDQKYFVKHSRYADSFQDMPESRRIKLNGLVWAIARGVREPMRDYEIEEL